MGRELACIRSRHRSGFALLTVMFFLAFAFGAWAVFYHSSAAALRLEEARSKRDTRTTWTAPAIAQGLRLLQTGNPPSDPYSCKMTIASDSETHYILLTYNQISLGRYTVAAAPTTADDPTHAAPATFLPVPDAPMGLVANAASSTEIDLSWSDVPNENGYYIERSADGSTGWVQIGSAAKNATNYSSTGLTPATTYYYRICATNSTGNGAYSAVVNATTPDVAPPAPGGLAAAAVSISEIDLSWNDVSNETGYLVERSPDGSSGWAQLNINAPNVTTYTDTGLSSGVTYYYRVRAFNLQGNSAYTSVVNATTTATPPGAPTTLAANAASTTQINLTWTDNSSNEIGFKVERSPDGSAWTQITTTAANATGYNDSTGLTANTTYYYRVRATNGAGDSSYSNTANTATLPNAPSMPSGLAAAAVDSSDINLTWTDNSSNETGFKIEQSPDGSTWTEITTVGANAGSLTASGLSASTKYYYRVRAYNAGGNSGYSNTTNATTTARPAVPSGLTATVVSATSVRLNWTDNSNNETGFRLQISSNGGSSWSVATTTAANVTSYTDTGLTINHAYLYRVRALGSSGNSSYSSTASVTPN